MKEKDVHIRLGVADQCNGFHWPEVEPLLTVRGLINAKICKHPVLVDSGASANFVSSDFVDRNGLEARKLKQPLKVSLANNAKMTVTSVLDNAYIQLPDMDGYGGIHQFMILDGLVGYGAVLGRPFLVKSGAIVDHSTDKITWTGTRSDALSWRSSDCTTKNANERRRTEARITTDPSPRLDIPKIACNSLSSASTSSTTLKQESSGDITHPQTGDKHQIGTADQRSRLNNVIDEYKSKLDPLKNELPPSRGEYDHSIKLKDESAKPARLPPIRQRPELMRAMKEKLEELLAKGLIRRSKSPYGAPAFMIEQESMKDGKKVMKLRMVINYKKLNEQTETNATSLPHVDELFARLGKAKVTSKMDLSNGFHQLRMNEKDIEKTAFTTPFGHFEWVVMPFGEKNAPASFVQFLTQDALVDLVHDFIIIFIDDILIFSENEEEHIEHVKTVLQKLAENELFINPDKCTWMVNELDFLGYRLRTGDGAVEMMIQENKVDAIRQWPVPTTINELRSFLGAANFSRTFIKDFSTIARPLTEATAGKHKSKSSRIIWGPAQQRAFDELKTALITAPALAIPDENKQFVLYTDASDFGIGASLCQWNDDEKAMQVCAYMSAKLKGAELNWPTHDKEMFALVKALKHWSMHFIMAKHPIKIFTDNKATLDMLKHDDNIPGKRSRWASVLTKFHLDPHGIKGEKNVLADGLSRRPDLDGGKEEVQAARREQLAETVKHLGLSMMTYTDSEAASPNLLSQIRNAYEKDEVTKKIISSPKQYHFQMKEGLIIDEGNRIIVPENRQIKTCIIQESHDTIVSGHLGIEKTVSRIRQHFEWRGLVKDVYDYVKSCKECQQSKARNLVDAGTLQPIAPPLTKGMVISIDFVGPLPRTARGKDFAMVITDRYSKRVFFESCRQTINAKQAAKIIFDRVVRHQGLPEIIISDRDPRFNAKLWRSLWQACGTKLAMTVSARAQANGGTETVNRVMQDMLRSFVNDARKDWDEKLPALEIAYNSSYNETTGMTPFELDIGMKPRLPIDIATKLTDNRNKSLIEFMNDWEENWALAHKKIFEAQSKQKKFFDKHRREEKYQLSDHAWLRKDRSALNDGLTEVSKLGPRVEGPYEITELHGDHNVSLKLDKGDKRHNRFHVSQLRPYVVRDLDRFPNVDDGDDDDDDDNEMNQDDTQVEVDGLTSQSSYHGTSSSKSIAQTSNNDESRPARQRTQIDHGFFVKH